ncbi:MAG: thiamine phosphate synthase [Deltaproteobacteria bacterium]|nr:thiamine phosphate synthase [Deltaproteobacteria bacterium]
MPVDAPKNGRISGLYAIIDASIIKPDGMEKTAHAVLEGGARIIQLRAKDFGGGAMLKAARLLRGLTSRYGALFIVNDRVDIALISGASGVHLGSDDIPAKDARALLGTTSIIGLSTHNLKEVEAAAGQGADYISFGPVFSTETKKDAQSPKGIEALKDAVRATRLPVVAIGGIGE